MTEVSLPKFHCYRCGHDWVPRKLPVLMCPKCKSKLWDKPKENKK